MGRQPIFSLIWAMDENRLIGRDNQLPWSLSADLKWFRKQTMGKPVLMGRKTFDSIGKPLPGRQNIIITRQDITIEGCTVVHSLKEARASANDAEEIMVIGGAEIYTRLLAAADRLYITQIHDTFEGDTWFPEFDLSDWQEIHYETCQPDEKTPYAYSFKILQRSR
jgi:dihydrofolate reductase